MRSLLRVGSLAVIVAAFFLARGSAHDRVLVVVVQGAPLPEVRALAQAGHLPNFESWLAGGVGGEIVSAREMASMDDLTRTLFESGSSAHDGSMDPLLAWEALERQGRPYALVGVADTDFEDDERRLVLAGPDVGSGFVGDNAGTVFNRRTIARGGLVWPYADVETALQSAIQELPPGQATDWIPWAGDASRPGVLKAHGLDRDTVYVSPIYTRFRRLPRDANSLYVADDPSRVRTNSRAEEYLPAHVVMLNEARATAALRVARRRDWDLFVWVDRGLSAFERNGRTPIEDLPDDLLEAYRGLDKAVGDLADATGERTVVLLIGLGDSVREAAGSAGWFSVGRVVGDLSSWGPVRGSEVAATVSYLLGFGTSSERQTVAAVASRFPVRAHARFLAGGRGDVIASTPATAAGLRDLSFRVATTRDPS